MVALVSAQNSLLVAQLSVPFLTVLSLYLLNFWLFYLVFFYFDRAIGIVSTDWVISASVTLHWVIPLSAWYFSFNHIFFVHMIWDIRISLFLTLLFFIHKVSNSLLNFAASVTDVFHAYFHFVFAGRILTLSWISHFFRLSGIYSLPNVIHWVISTHSGWPSIWNIVCYLNSWVVPWNRSNLWFWLIHLIWRSSHQSVLQIILVRLLTRFWTHYRRDFVSS